ncbi:DNA-damage-repair/toleration protein DRT100-like, partial [Trifolium medium]|nr:DNA-damage-repair/toleration protein DRT100-like [Trifolium medium]
MSIVRISGLMHLDLSNNQIIGELPSDFGKLCKLSRVLLSRNQLV